MIRERARVLEAFAGGAWVRTESQSGCARCASGQGCGSATLGRLLGDRLRRVEVASAEPLSSGSVVEIAIDERVLSSAALVVYGLPLALLLIGAVVGDAVGVSVDASVGSDLVATIGAVLGLLLGMRLARRLARRLTPSTLRPRVLRTLAAGQSCDG